MIDPIPLSSPARAFVHPIPNSKGDRTRHGGRDYAKLFFFVRMSKFDYQSKEVSTMPKVTLSFNSAIAACLRIDSQLAGRLCILENDPLSRQMYYFASDWLEKFAHVIWENSEANDAIVSAWADHFESDNKFLRNVELDERASKGDLRFVMSRVERELRQSIPMIADASHRKIIDRFAMQLMSMANCWILFTTKQFDQMETVGKTFSTHLESYAAKNNVLPSQPYNPVVVAIPPSPLDHKPQAPDVSLNVVMPERRPIDAAIVRDDAGQVIGMTSVER